MPDYHFLYIDKILDADWFLVAAQRYWQRFRPIVISDLDLVSYVPPTRTVTITTLARRDIAPMINDLVAKKLPKVHHDRLVYDNADDMQLTLDGRADLDQPFGVPEAPPTPSKPLRAPTMSSSTVPSATVATAAATLTPAKKPTKAK